MSKNATNDRNKNNNINYGMIIVIIMDLVINSHLRNCFLQLCNSCYQEHSTGINAAVNAA